jgi:molybdopterin-containing oxidoreductase family membrane subunit
MLERMFGGGGGRAYWLWLGALGLVAAAGVAAWLRQLGVGLAVTGLGQSVAWGLYIGQLTFLVGVAASAVMVVLPAALHGYRPFEPLTVLGELLSIGALVTAGLFVLVDLGQPGRVMNLALYPAPTSMLFWDAVVLGGYLVLNVVLARASLSARRAGEAPPGWLRPLVYLSIPWAVAIHTVTAFLYAGLEGRPFWLTAILAPRFLSSAFASGPACLVLLCLALRGLGVFDAGVRAVAKLLEIVAYAMVVTVFFVLLELFTGLYPGLPDHAAHFAALYAGPVAPWAWASVALSIAALLLLVVPPARRHRVLGPLAAGFAIGGVWAEKGFAMIVAGQTPDQLGRVATYAPTVNEVAITIGVYAVGAVVVTLLLRAALPVESERA